MELSLAGLLGAFVGTVLGVINYAVIVGFVESRLRALDKSETAAEREEFERKISLMRRIILGLDIFVFAGVGYVVGKTIGG
jgi:hypothetical protein